MSDQEQQEAEPKYKPTDGSKFIFELTPRVKIRFNVDGWVEEMYQRSAGEPVGLKLQGDPSTKRDDMFARRYYDLISRVVMVDVHTTNNGNDASRSAGIIQFKDLEPESGMYERVKTIIEIANQLGIEIAPLK